MWLAWAAQHPQAVALTARCLQGDVLSGCIAAFTSWAVNHGGHKLGGKADYPESLPPTVLAAYGGCLTARTAAGAAFAKRRRSMLAGDVIEELGDAVDWLFDSTRD